MSGAGIKIGLANFKRDTGSKIHSSDQRFLGCLESPPTGKNGFNGGSASRRFEFDASCNFERPYNVLGRFCIGVRPRSDPDIIKKGDLWLPKVRQPCRPGLGASWGRPEEP